MLVRYFGFWLLLLTVFGIGESPRVEVERKLQADQSERPGCVTRSNDMALWETTLVEPYFTGETTALCRRMIFGLAVMTTMILSGPSRGQSWLTSTIGIGRDAPNAVFNSASGLLGTTSSLASFGSAERMVRPPAQLPSNWAISGSEEMRAAGTIKTGVSCCRPLSANRNTLVPDTCGGKCVSLGIGRGRVTFHPAPGSAPLPIPSASCSCEAKTYVSKLLGSYHNSTSVWGGFTFNSLRKIFLSIDSGARSCVTSPIKASNVASVVTAFACNSDVLLCSCSSLACCSSSFLVASDNVAAKCRSSRVALSAEHCALPAAVSALSASCWRWFARSSLVFWMVVSKSPSFASTRSSPTMPKTTSATLASSKNNLRRLGLDGNGPVQVVCASDHSRYSLIWSHPIKASSQATPTMTHQVQNWSHPSSESWWTDKPANIALYAESPIDQLRRLREEQVQMLNFQTIALTVIIVSAFAFVFV
jgi:hypothetical protein